MRKDALRILEFLVLLSLLPVSFMFTAGANKAAMNQETQKDDIHSTKTEMEIRKEYDEFMKTVADNVYYERKLDITSLVNLVRNRRRVEHDVLDVIANYAMSEKESVEEHIDKEAIHAHTHGRHYTIKPLHQQLAYLSLFFPKLAELTLEEIQFSYPPLPDGAAGYLFVPRWNFIANSYNEAVINVLQAIKLSRNGNFLNYCEGGELRLKLVLDDEDIKRRFMKGGDRMIKPGPVFDVFPIQTGQSYMFSSEFDRRKIGGNEFFLDTYEVAIFLLTHPERLLSYEDHWIEVRGDKYAPLGIETDNFTSHNVFFFEHRMLACGTRDTNAPSLPRALGIPTGFFVKSASKE